MPTPEQLHLHDSQLFSTRKHPDTDKVGSAVFFVEASEGDRQPQPYKFTVMDYTDYLAWRMEQRFSLEDEERDQPAFYPLVVTEIEIAGGGLVRFVQQTYLDNENPTAINDVRQFLEGPLED